MIIAANKELPIGQIYQDDDFVIYDVHGNLFKSQPFMVLRQATRDEYEQGCAANTGIPISEVWGLFFLHFFYEVSFD